LAHEVVFELQKKNKNDAQNLAESIILLYRKGISEQELS
jgi:hypothetical protein